MSIEKILSDAKTHVYTCYLTGYTGIEGKDELREAISHLGSQEASLVMLASFALGKHHSENGVPIHSIDEMIDLLKSLLHVKK